MQEMLERVEALERALAELRRDKQAAEQRAQRWRVGSVLGLLLVALLLGGTPASAQLTLEQRVAGLESKLVYLTRSGKNMYLNGVNLILRNGAGRTDSANGFGNLVLGYAELRPLNPDGSNPNVRTGSHCLVMGWQPSFGSYGGIVAGYQNNILGPYASVTGGFYNTASGTYASVSGGQGNVANGPYASVSGGDGNTASGSWASVSGGSYSKALGEYSSVSGGNLNQAIGFNSSVTGGSGNWAKARYSCVSGGVGNEAQGAWSCVSGGKGRIIGRDYNWGAGTPAGGTLTQGWFFSEK